MTEEVGGMQSSVFSVTADSLEKSPSIRRLSLTHELLDQSWWQYTFLCTISALYSHNFKISKNE